MSAKPCGCDPEASWICERHTKPANVAVDPGIFDQLAALPADEQKKELEALVTLAGLDLIPFEIGEEASKRLEAL